MCLRIRASSTKGSSQIRCWISLRSSTMQRAATSRMEVHGAKGRSTSKRWTIFIRATASSSTLRTTSRAIMRACTKFGRSSIALTTSLLLRIFTQTLKINSKLPSMTHSASRIEDTPFSCNLKTIWLFSSLIKSQLTGFSLRMHQESSYKTLIYPTIGMQLLSHRWMWLLSPSSRKARIAHTTQALTSLRIQPQPKFLQEIIRCQPKGSIT